MKNIKVVSAALALLLSGMAIAGCSSNEAKTPANAGQGEGESKKKITIELLEGGWDNTPTDEHDPFKKWIDEKFNVDFKLSNVTQADFETKVLTRFASQDPPDIIYTHDRNVMMKLYNQGVLLEDWKPVLDKVPTISNVLDDAAKGFVTIDGKMIALPKPPDLGNWSLKIRKDWLENLKLDIPRTDEELIEVMRQFTFNDPDNNGKNDTWGISSNGEGKSIGTLASLEAMYGPIGFQIKDNQVDHSIVNGTHKKFLDFIKKISDEKLIDPDWYTQSWAQKGTKTFTDKLGVEWYPGVLAAEYDQNNGSNGKAADIWEYMDMPKGSDEGGKVFPGAPIGGMISISAKAAQDPEKLERILELVDAVSYPNEGFWALRWGVGIADQKVIDLEGGSKFFSQSDSDYRKKVTGAWDYGTWIATNRDQVLQTPSKEPGPVEKTMIELDQKATAAETYKNYEAFLTLDPQLISDVGKLQQEFDIKYVLGESTDYEGFVKNWLASGGQQLLDQAKEQFTAAGQLK
ncbi:hypothetical protein [Paenibacillus sp. GCM10027626]|uniref:hypothetical protein n=1 Tax=Paenibacillus sp. GCM10027626 TaxID=3273411 RepID=UPI00362A48AC